MKFASKSITNASRAASVASIRMEGISLIGQRGICYPVIRTILRESVIAAKCLFVMRPAGKWAITASKYLDAPLVRSTDYYGTDGRGAAHPYDFHWDNGKARRNLTNSHC
jgi:hypothetical protein